MILAYLREFRRKYISKVHELEHITLGEYLLKFFEFYAVKNDWAKKRVIMHEGGAIIDKSYDTNFSLISP